MAILKALEIGGSILRPQFRDALLNFVKNGGNHKNWHPGAQIHPSAIIHPAASVDDGVVVGPFCVVGEGVVLGSGCKLLSHVSVHSNTIIGDDSVIHPFASIGGDPQDLKYKQECSWLILGCKNIIREHASINRGTLGGGSCTRTGNGCLFMSGTHVGHDCQIGNNVIVSTGAGLAGHVVVEDNAIIGGLVGIRQRVHIGRGAMVGGKSAVVNDVLPYTLVAGNPAAYKGLNLVGLRRQGCSRDEMRCLTQLMQVIYGENVLSNSLTERVANFSRSMSGQSSARVKHLLTFLDKPMPCGICPGSTCESTSLL